jgi:hypothetical protein
MALSCVTTHNLKYIFLYDPDLWGGGSNKSYSTHKISTNTSGYSILGKANMQAIYIFRQYILI